MAILDRERNVIVIRVVYDGPPEAGKTTSLRALAGSLGQPLASPAEEYGRTLYFDWMDYTAGRFEGYQIRCQVVSVPGQAELGQRRRHLLSSADVVVFVADSTRSHLAETLERLGSLSRVLAASEAPAVGVIVQANKRDVPEAIAMDELRARVREVGGHIGVVESIAAEGSGIREAFVFSVRLALDRVRELLNSRALKSGRPDIDSSEELLAQMRGLEPPQPNTTSLPARMPAAVPMIQQVLDENDAALASTPWRDVSVSVGDEERPRSPDPSAPSGAIWPPVEGRVILHEAASTRMTTHRLRSGGWVAGLGNGWRIFSGADNVYGDLEAGRAMLIRLARLHAACAGVISVTRCVVLAATGQGTWRLWQIVRAERSLRERLEELRECSTDDAAARILEAASLLCDIGGRIQKAPCSLPCTLDTIGSNDRGAVYVGLMPMDATEPVVADIGRSIGSELGAVVHSVMQERRADVLAAITRNARVGYRGTPPTRMLDEVLGHMTAA